MYANGCCLARSIEVAWAGVRFWFEKPRLVCTGADGGTIFLIVIRVGCPSPVFEKLGVGYRSPDSPPTWASFCDLVIYDSASSGARR